MNRGARITIAALALSGSGLIGMAVHEGYTDEAIIPVKGDVPTYGFGETRGVKMGDRTTPVRALVRLGASVSEKERSLRACLGDVELYQHEWDAYVSLAYNVGPAAVCSSSIRAKLQARQYEAACATIRDFNGMCVKRDPATRRCLEKRVLRGLDIRRQAEVKQCMGEGHS